jgi:peptide/nickel transport system permease protein
MSQRDYLIRKLGWGLFTVLFVIALNFFLFRIMPGDPAKAGIKDPRLGQAQQEALRVRFGLDKPVFLNLKGGNPFDSQFFIYAVNLARGDLGLSYKENRPVIDILLDRLWRTVVLVMLAEIVSILLGVGLGLLAAWRRGSSFDVWALAFSLITWSLPTFFLGIIMLVLASSRMNLAGLARTLGITGGLGAVLVALWRLPGILRPADGTPAMGWRRLFNILLTWGGSLVVLYLFVLFVVRGGFPTGGMETAGRTYPNLASYLLDLSKHIVLPTITFGLVLLGEYMIIMRSSVLEILSEDYILTAKAKGLTNWQILRDHALKNAMLPIVTLVALNLGFTVSGAIQLETVFSWPGLGRTVFDALSKLDYPVLQGAFLLLAISVILANLSADLLYSYLDPRIRNV